MIAWDAHAHVIGDPRQFPFWNGRGYTPPPAPLDAYLAMLDRYEIARGVLVQPSVYGHDHRCLFDALARARGRLTGAAVPSPDATTRDLESMHERGIRAVRCNLINPGGLSPATVISWQPALRDLGWHVEFQIPVNPSSRWFDVVSGFEIPVVIDHFGRPAPGLIHPASPDLARLVALVRDNRCFVKLSAAYRVSSQDAPWKDVTPLARALIEANASACLWGSDWPHVDTTPSVNTADVVSALDDWSDTAETRRAVTTSARRLFDYRPNAAPPVGS